MQVEDRSLQAHDHNSGSNNPYNPKGPTPMPRPKVEHPRYDRYENPYASPPELYESSVCADCDGPTGETGLSGWKNYCQICRDTFSLIINSYPQEDYYDQ